MNKVMQRLNITKLVALTFFVSMILGIQCCQAQTAQIIYVKKGAVGNGASWSAAFGDLQQALSAASSISGKKEIWVSAGEYKPSSALDRSASFVIPANTTLYGGFAGNETTKDARNWTINRSVLSGDLGKQFDYTDNSYHVLRLKDVDSEAGLDGFIITEGYANGSNSPNYDDHGGGLIIIADNSASSPTINNCEFINNFATAAGGGLAAVSLGNSLAAQIANCYFNGNSAMNGGGVSVQNVSSTNTTTFVNCSFSTNHASGKGGALNNSGGSNSSIINNTFCKNNSLLGGGAIYIQSGNPSIYNSILWKNFNGATEAGSTINQIKVDGGQPDIKDNIVQGGWGSTANKNVNADPMFVREPSFTPKYPRTSIIPVSSTNPKYEKQLAFNGDRLHGPWPYYCYNDHEYNKLYMGGRHFQTLDFNNLVNNAPTSRIYPEIYFPSTQRLSQSIHRASNKIFIASYYSGINAINRATGVVTNLNVLDGEPVTTEFTLVKDLVVDEERGLLYAPVFLGWSFKFYGLLEYNINSGAKRWINQTSTGVNIPVAVLDNNEDQRWGLSRLFYDKPGDVLYFSTGSGVWWWNKTTNATGVISTSTSFGSGSPSLPTNLTTGIYKDPNSNQLYIGTHLGLFVINNNTNTTKLFNTSNSKMMHNLVNTIDKDPVTNTVFVACEEGGLFIINENTGEQLLIKEDVGNEIYPQFMDNAAGSAFFDHTDRKLYVAADHWDGGVWIRDYNNLVPDYGDLSLKKTSPAIDFANASLYPSTPLVDILGHTRLADYSTGGSSLLDKGAYELPTNCANIPASFTFSDANNVHTFVYTGSLPSDQNCIVNYQWDFGDGTQSSVASPTHTFPSDGLYTVSLTVRYSCDNCSEVESSNSQTVVVGACDELQCDGNGNVGIGKVRLANGYKLSVDGKIITTGLRVAMDNTWPDYVFHKEYPLPTLKELKFFINENGHLPNIPSAIDVSKEGLDAGEMSQKLVEKVEELTLYLIQLNDRLKAIENSTEK